ncbi:hypothetical protein [Desulfobulbus elongatus]|uniref:hypothetical protein n=1 Tax=Desulfobulbus elongatus TaxID=53332 RepID=UPI000684B61B|nr:hypothetical protein [Desulfobulbus elongatus]
MHDLEGTLALEIKKEMADRYFGFRKMIEEDSQQYSRHLREAYRQLENEVGFDLIRLYILLGRESLIHDFFRLTGMRDQVFLDPYLLSSPTIRQRLFKGQLIHGLTRRSRFRHLFFDLYDRLRAGVATYTATLRRLVEEGKTIAAEIDEFHRNNDLGTMMGFLRRLDGGAMQEEGPMVGGLSPQRDSALAGKMRLATPIGAETLLPAIPDLPAVHTCRGRLQELVDTAFTVQGKPEVRDYTR